MLVTCGDGATSDGDYYEALNFTAVFHPPVIFFVQSTKYAISVPLAHLRGALARPQGRRLRQNYVPEAS